MSKAIAFLLCSLFIASITAQYNSTNCGANACADTSGKHVCFNGQCVECNPSSNSYNNGDCMCDAGEYCVSDSSSEDYATCQSFEGAILGNVCDPGLSVGQISLGVNDKLYCGKLFWNLSNLLVGPSVEWSGFCDAGVCRHCGDGNGNQCPGKEGYGCMAGRFVNSNAGEFSWPFFASNVINWSSFWTFIWLYIFFPAGLIFYRLFISDASTTAPKKHAPQTQLEMQRVETMVPEPASSEPTNDYTAPPPRPGSVEPSNSARSSKIISAQQNDESERRASQRYSSQVNSPPSPAYSSQRASAQIRDPPEYEAQETRGSVVEEHWDEAEDE